VVLRRTRDGIHAHADQAARQNIARESRRSGAGNFLGQRDNLRLIPLLVDGNGDVGVALCLYTQGVTQAVGISSPEMSAVAPAGVVAMEMFSVVPRVTDAPPKHGSTIAVAKSEHRPSVLARPLRTARSLIIGLSPPRPPKPSQP
jgi:hypothetical protein